MGIIYSEFVLVIDELKVGLFNIGEELLKGNDLVVRIY